MIVEKSTQVSGVYGNGTAAISTSAPINTSSFKIRRGVTVSALSNNTDIVYVGLDSSLTVSNGYPLAKGESIFVEVDDLSKIWLIGGDTSQLYRYLGV